MATEEVRGPQGRFVVRTERRGVPINATLLAGAADIVLRFRRLLRRDQAWLVRVRRKTQDPFGPDVFSEVVPDKAHLGAAWDRAVAAIRAGTLELTVPTVHDVIRQARILFPGIDVTEDFVGDDIIEGDGEQELRGVSSNLVAPSAQRKDRGASSRRCRASFRSVCRSRPGRERSADRGRGEPGLSDRRRRAVPSRSGGVGRAWHGPRPRVGVGS